MSLSKRPTFVDDHDLTKPVGFTAEEVEIVRALAHPFWVSLLEGYEPQKEHGETSLGSFFLRLWRLGHGAPLDTASQVKDHA